MGDSIPPAHISGEGPSGGGAPAVWTLTYIFGFLYVLTATQDIAVDGWALTMLSPQNVGMASTANTIGQTVGYLVAYVVFLAFNSADFCNTLSCFQQQASALALAQA